MKKTFLLFAFLLLAPFGLEAQESSKITEALAAPPTARAESEPAGESQTGEAHSILTAKPEKSEVSEPAKADSRPTGTDSELIPFQPAAAFPEPEESSPPAELIPFHPAETFPSEKALTEDPAQAISAILRKYGFPYDFIKVKVLQENAVSRPADGAMRMELPLIISFDSERYAAFHAEMRPLLERTALSAPQSVTISSPVKKRFLGKKNIYLNLHAEGDHYASYELPQSCRQVLADYAALLPVASLVLYDEKREVLSRHFFPLVYRDIVKAYPINLMGVYQTDYQTLRIFPHQADAFAAFIQSQASSFIIPERFTVISASTASNTFLAKFAKSYWLESAFRRGDRFPEIPYVLQIQVPMEQFRQIRFMNCAITADQPGETPVKPTASFEMTEEEWKQLEEVGETPTPAPETVPLEAAAPVAETPAAETTQNPENSIPVSALSSAPALEAALQNVLSAQPTLALSSFGKTEKNCALNRNEISALGKAFRILRIEKKQTFRTTPEMDLASLGWLEVSPTVSITFLYPTAEAKDSEETKLTPTAALWLSLEDGTLALVHCELGPDFVQLLNQKLAEHDEK